MVHHDDARGTNKLDAARQEPQEQIVAREQVKRSLDEARVMIPMLETQLEWIAQGEPLSRTDDQRHEVERQLEEERLDRQQAEQEREGSCQPSGGRGTAVRGPWPLRWLRRLLERQEPPRRDPVRGNAVPPISLERPHGSQQGLAGYRLDDKRPIPNSTYALIVTRRSRADHGGGDCDRHCSASSAPRW